MWYGAGFSVLRVDFEQVRDIPKVISRDLDLVDMVTRQHSSTR
jgi:hypothetical protein